MASVKEIRELFPILSTKLYGKDLVYFDNAATAQRPQQVIDICRSLASETNANIHRGIHKLAEDATEAFETTRDIVKNYINAESREEIIFTSEISFPNNLAASSVTY